MPDEREERAYRFGPLERRGTVGGLRLGQAVTIGGGCVLSVLLLRVLPGSQAMPAAVLVLLIAGAAAILPISGRTDPTSGSQSSPARSPRVCEASTGIGRGEQARASRALSTARPSSDRRRCRRCCAAAACSAPISPTAASWECSRTQSWARTRPSSSSHARAVSLLPPAEHERRLEQWGQVLAALARRGSAIRRLQIIEHTAPSDGHLRQPAAFR